MSCYGCKHYVPGADIDFDTGMPLPPECDEVTRLYNATSGSAEEEELYLLLQDTLFALAAQGICPRFRDRRSK